jgi:hypothetical protein
MLSAMACGIADHGQRPGREQAAQISVASFADAAKLFLASARVLLGHEPDPSREVPPRSESPRITDAGNQSCGQRRTDARDLIEALARLAGSMPGHDQAIELQDLSLQRPQLAAERHGFVISSSMPLGCTLSGGRTPAGLRMPLFEPSRGTRLCSIVIRRRRARIERGVQWT